MKSTLNSGAASGSSARSAHTGRSSGAGSSGALSRRFDQSVCAFWLGGQCYGLASALVGEVFMVESCTPVPVGPPSVLGLFNLRGTPVALVDLASVLELPEAAVPEGTDTALMALVLRANKLLVGTRIRRMEVVIPSGKALFRPAQEGATEHPVVAGFLELPERSELTITLLDPEALVARLSRLRYLSSDEAS
jgi:purine-binding chemotaxis protein CheW